MWFASLRLLKLGQICSALRESIQIQSDSQLFIQSQIQPIQFTMISLIQICSAALIPYQISTVSANLRLLQIHRHSFRFVQIRSNRQILKGRGTMSCSSSSAQREKGKARTQTFYDDSKWITLRAHMHGRDETTSRLGYPVLADFLPPTPDLRQPFSPSRFSSHPQVSSRIESNFFRRSHRTLWATSP